MEEKSSRRRLFGFIACAGQLAALFPFAVMFESLSVGGFVVWHFLAIYAVWTAFREFGLLAATLTERAKWGRLPKKLHPLMNFLSKTAFLIPTIAFIAVGVRLGFGTDVFFYLLPPGIAICIAGNICMGRGYSEIFTKAWFGVYMISAVLTMIMLATDKKLDVSPAAGQILCAGFAVVILLLVVLTNQTNIDNCTKQRDSGKAALPHGLRTYNTLIVFGIFAVALGLFVFAKPLGRLVLRVVSAVVGAVLFIMEKFAALFEFDESELMPSEGFDEYLIPAQETSGGWHDIMITLAIIAGIVCLIVFRKQIVRAIKAFFAPLFRNRAKGADTPFADEITSSDAKQLSARARRKAERELARRYSRETDPERKFRLGYALFLAQLSHTKHAPELSDTTDTHRAKGESAFGESLSEFTETYNKVRYADIPPTTEELNAQSELLTRLSSADIGK